MSYLGDLNYFTKEQTKYKNNERNRILHCTNGTPEEKSAQIDALINECSYKRALFVQLLELLYK